MVLVEVNPLDIPSCILGANMKVTIIRWGSANGQGKEVSREVLFCIACSPDLLYLLTSYCSSALGCLPIL
jgi:hypothetical protein